MQLNRTLIMTLTAVVAALSALWFTTGAVTPKEATWDDVLAEAKNGGYRIITTQELGAAYSKNANEFLLVDTRQEWEYRTGHIKAERSISRWNRPGGRAGARRTR